MILSMMLINDRIYSTRQETQICFDRALIIFILYFISDACWAAVLSGQFPRTRFFVVLFNFTNHVLLHLMAYAWFMFMAAAEKMAFRNSRREMILCMLPMIVSVAALVTAYVANPYFWVTENGELNSLYYPMLIVIPACYLLTAFILSVIRAGKTEQREEKWMYWLIGIFPLGVLAFGMIQVISLNAPTFCFGCTIMLLFFYIQRMQTQISVDALTRLNNRGQINRFMEQLHYRENTKVFVMMIDIDGFKQINDTYGHAEGDRALILVSEVLKKTCDNMKAPVFLGRYGGDEFVMFIQNPEEEEHPKQIAGVLRGALSEAQRENRLPYDLKLSIGYDELADRKDTVEDCLKRADKRLYQEKRKKGTLR